MKLLRISLAALLVAGLAGVALVAQRTETAATEMANAANAFLGKLADDQKAKAAFPFDTKERTRWFFTPQQDNKTKMATRKGLALEQMSAEQKKAALDLLAVGTGPVGKEKAVLIMSLESILKDQEKGGAMIRNPEWYFFTIFGTPGPKGKWGWRVEGHHLSLNFTIEDGKVLAATPYVFGANPAVIKSGPKKGLSVLPETEDHARALFTSLDADQKKIAQRDKAFSEPKEQKIDSEVGQPTGLPAAKMTDKQKAILQQLLDGYTGRMRPEIGAEEMAQIKQAGFDKVHFAFHGSTEPGKGHSYRVQGPTFVIEFLNVQADAGGNANNHIHSAWRHIGGDFGIKTAAK